MPLASLLTMMMLPARELFARASPIYSESDLC